MCNKKHLLYRRYLKNPTAYRKNKYSSYRNLVTSEIRKCKREYYFKLFKKSCNNTKATWKTINQILCRVKKKVNNLCIEIDGDQVFDKEKIVNAFNDYFVHIGDSIVNSLPDAQNNYSDFLPQKEYPHSMFMSQIECHEILEIVQHLDKNKSPGYDGINVDILKKTILLFVDPLCNIFNSSLQNGVFPHKFKLAKIAPIFKKGDKHSLNNYRPISVLSTFSKIFEKLIYTRLMSFLCKRKILYDRQYGFRKSHSSYMALLDFTNTISQAFENKQFMIGIFLDLSKAFDCINHNILLEKMYFYGIRGLCLDWFKSYLSDRVQYVSIDNVSSEIKSLSLGVPQGSVLGPLLFLLYVNDIQYASDILKSIVFADDTNLFLSGDNVQTVRNNLESEVPKINSWFLANRLKLNVDKTCCMLFKPKNKQINSNELDIVINDIRIPYVHSTKFLGVTIDDRLTWKDHINDIACKVARTSGVMNRLKHILPQNILFNLYNTMVLPYFNYCNIVWGKCAQCHLSRLISLQKRAIRIISKSQPLTHTDPLFQKFKLLTLDQINKQQIALFMYSYCNSLLPNFLQTRFIQNKYITHRLTRQANNLFIPNFKYQFSRNTIRFTGPTLWNSIPENLKDAPRLSSFKRKYKNFLLGT